MIKLPEPRKAYTCAACDHTYLDAPVTGCDCMPVENKFTEENLYTEAQLKQAISDALEDATQKPIWQELSEEGINETFRTAACKCLDGADSFRRAVYTAISASLRAKNRGAL